MNKEKIDKMLFLSKKLKPLIIALRQAKELHLSLREFKKISAEMMPVINTMESSIAKIRLEIYNIFINLEGYEGNMIEINYISTHDIEDGFVPVTKNEDIYLNLSTGLFCKIKDVPRGVIDSLQ